MASGKDEPLRKDAIIGSPKKKTFTFVYFIVQVTVPMARASVLWIIGEYSSHVTKIAPDVLRQMAK